MKTKPLKKEHSKVNATNYIMTLLMVYILIGTFIYSYVATHRTDIEVCNENRN